MRLWLSRNSAAGLREQLVTQIRLSILSGDLPAATRLPSVRDVARRHGVHANTVSAAYRDLEEQGWLESRKGSGVYANDLRTARTEESPLDGIVRDFLSATRARGFSSSEVRASLIRALGGESVRRLLVAEPEPELCAILVAELEGRLGIPVSACDWRSKTVASDAAVTAMLGRADGLPSGVPRHFLRLRSLAEHFAGQQRPAPEALIGVASSSPEILRRIRTLLIAAGLDERALEFRDAREPGWSRGLQACAYVIVDVVTAYRLPKKCTARVLHVLSEASIEELREFLRLVTDAKVS
jgi:DNA-binding transcriptional regulator YhcF (GntR family)